MRILLLLIVIVVTLPAGASDLSLKLGGWSYHTKGLKHKLVEGFKYNQSHQGLGLNYVYDSGLVVDVWCMKDSYSQNAYQIGVGQRYEINKYFDVNVMLTYFDRSIGNVMNDKGVYSIKTSRVKYVFPVAYLTVSITEDFNLDFIAFPTKGKYMLDGGAVTEINYTFFVRAGIVF